MKRNLIVTGVLIVLCSIIVHAQAAKPGPEHKKLAAFLGAWSIDGATKPGNLYGVPAGKMTLVERYQWLPGEFFLQMNREGKGPAGDFKHSIIFGYDSFTKKYTGTWYDFMSGGSMSATLTNNGNAWIWTGTGHTGDAKTFQERCTITFAANGATWTVTCETSADGKTWSPSYEAKATKEKS